LYLELLEWEADQRVPRAVLSFMLAALFLSHLILFSEL
jgi:hypothetical protein